MFWATVLLPSHGFDQVIFKSLLMDEKDEILPQSSAYTFLIQSRELAKKGNINSVFLDIMDNARLSRLSDILKNINI